MGKQAKILTDRPDRWPVELRGFALNAEHDTDVVISDMSYEGCRIEAEDAFTPGEVVELRILRRGRADAQIRWAKAGAAGVRFLS